MAENDGVIIPFIADMSKFDDAIKGTIEQLTEMGTISDDTASKFKTAQAGMAQGAQGTTAEVKNLGESFKQLGANIAGGALKQGVEDLTALSTSAATLRENIKSLTTQIVSNTKALQDMAASGKQATDDFKQLEQQTDKLNGILSKVRDGLKSASAEFKGLTTARNVLQGIQGGFDAAANAALLFGTKNEEAEKAVEALTQVSAVLNGVVEAGNAIRETAIALTNSETLASRAAAAAAEFFGEASAAAWAAATAGISLLVAGIALLIANFKNASESAEIFFGKLIEQENEKTRLLEKLAEANKVNKEQGESEIKLKEREIELAKANTNDKVKINALEKEKLDIMLRQAETYSKNNEVSKKELERAKLEIEVNKKLIESLEKQHNSTKGDDEKKRLEGQIALYEVQIKNDKTILQNAEAWRQNEEAIKDLKNEQLVNEAQLANLKNEQYKKDQEQLQLHLQAKLSQTQAGSFEELKAQRALAEQAYLAIKNDSKKNDDEKEIAKNEWIKKDNDLITAYYKKQDDDIKKAGKEQLDTEIEALQLQMNTEAQFGDERIELFKLIQARQLEIAELTNENLKDKTSLEYKNFVEKQRQELSKFTADIQKAKNDLANKTPTVDGTSAANKTSDDTEKAKQAKKLKDEKDYSKQAIDFAKQTTDQIFAIQDQARNAKYNADIDRLQKTASFELDNHNLTQAQKIAIQRKFDKEIAATKLQQWKAEQKSKEEQAIINGFLAITNILATMDWADFGVGQAIAIASSVAATAASVSSIAAQKPPAFASGTPAGQPDTPHGLKLVGEEGPELIYTKGGERIIPAPETAEILMRYGIPAMPAVNETQYEQAISATMPPINEDSLAKKIASELSKNPVASINMDKDGFATYLLQRGNRRVLLNNKFKA